MNHIYVINKRIILKYINCSINYLAAISHFFFVGSFHQRLAPSSFFAFEFLFSTYNFNVIYFIDKTYAYLCEFSTAPEHRRMDHGSLIDRERIYTIHI